MRLETHLAVVSLCLIASPLIAAAPSSRGTVNVRVSIEVGRFELGKKQSSSTYELMVATDGEQAEMSTGTRFPVATSAASAASADEAKAQPPPSITYQNVGMTARLKADISESGSIRVQGRIDMTSVPEGAIPLNSLTPPTFGQLSETVNVLLKSGKPARLVSVQEPGRGSSYLEIKAEIVE